MKPVLLKAKADNRFIIFLRDMAAMLIAIALCCVADARIGAPFLLPLLALGPAAFAARRYGTAGGLVVSLATALLGLSLHVTAGRHPIEDEAWETIASALFLGVTAYLVARVGRVEKRLIAIAATDSLTGLYNRRALLEAAGIEINRQRRSEKPLSVVHIDLDNFKRVNDTFGHSEGDRVLCAVANVLRSGRSTDFAARLGGDEFVLLLSDTSPQAARVMVDRLRARLRDAMVNGKWSDVTCSVGIATFLRPAESAEALIHSADTQMYDVKRTSKDGVRQVVVDGGHSTSLLAMNAAGSRR